MALAKRAWGQPPVPSGKEGVMGYRPLSRMRRDSLVDFVTIILSGCSPISSLACQSNLNPGDASFARRYLEPFSRPFEKSRIHPSGIGLIMTANARTDCRRQRISRR